MADFDPSEPPAKKQRLSGEYQAAREHPLGSSPPHSNSTPKPERFFQNPGQPVVSSPRLSPPAVRSSPLPSLRNNGHSAAARRSTPPKSESSTLPHESSTVTLDEEMFESIVGHKVDPEVMAVIWENCRGNLERAVNMYFDGTWKQLKPAVRNIPTTTNAPASKKEPVVKAEIPPLPQRSKPQPRYIGAFGVEGWATRSGHNLLRHGDTVKIDRQKIQRLQVTAKGQRKLGMPVVTSRMTAAAARRGDVLVRFTNEAGSEIGRLSKETADWVSTLIDQGICQFEGTCVYAPERLRTNDTLFLQLRVHLLPSAFDAQVLHPSDDIAIGFKEEDETSQEKDLRLRQVALARLFQEINLLPSTLNAADAKEQRQRLLEAAELDDKQPREAPKPAESNGTPSSQAEEAEEGKELEQDQLDALYRKAQSFDFNTPQAEPADTFALHLRPYQKQALHWMLMKEKGEEGDQAPSLHPLWEEYTWPLKDADDDELPTFEDQEKFYVNPYSGEMTLVFPAQEQHCLGGILADEMGLGKTIQMLSLIHSHQPHDRVRPKTGLSSLQQLRSSGMGKSEVRRAPHTTLVIAPMSLLAQWQSEAEKASNEGTIKTMVYYGSEKNANLQTMCCEDNAASAPDVIITSFGMVLSEYSQILARKGDRSQHTGLFSLNFLRIIVDEAHTIKNRSSKTSKACYSLAADHRWVLTGTPIVNRLEDLFSLVRFLGVEPWNNFSFWRTFITVPFESKNFVRALDVVQTVLEPLVMRRTKDMKTPDGKLLVPLPPKHIEIVQVDLSETERDIYNLVLSRAKSTLNDNMASGTVMKAYASLFAQIIRLRQTCCHPILVRNRDLVADEDEAAAAADAATGLADDMDLDVLMQRFAADIEEQARPSVTFGAHVLEQIRGEASHECPICTEEPMVEQTVTGCWHSACKKCLLDYMKHETSRGKVPRCVHCREAINARDLFEVIRHDDDDYGGGSGSGSGSEVAAVTDPAQGKAGRISLQRVGAASDSSSKVVTLIRHLRELRREHPRMKSVVFSQFTSFLSLIEPALARSNIRYLRLDGTMSQKARAAVLAEFGGPAAEDSFTVLLISLRAGGVGLNLTAARRVYMMDPWWSFAVEAQAIDRVHRMGQEGEVRVCRFIVKDSVEERMLRVQERKKFIASSLGMMSDEEKRLQRIEDIKDLLS